MANEEYRDVQIEKISGKDTFVEFTRESFDGDKVVLWFNQFDNSKPGGSKITQEIKIYVKMTEFLALSVDVTSGRMCRRKQKCLADNKKYEELFKSMTGSTAEQMTKKGKGRADNMAESRIFTIMPASSPKQDFILKAVSGAGKVSETGIIAPAYNGKPDKQIMVAFTQDILVGVCEVVRMYYQGYLNAKMNLLLRKDAEWKKNNQY